MLNQILCKPFALYPPAVNSVYSILENLIKTGAGPVDDAQRSGHQIKKHKSTAIVSTKGVMLKEAGWLGSWGFAGYRDTGESLLAAREDEEIDNILWVVDTPGGSVDGLDEFSELVTDINHQKPIHVQVDGMLASAGVYMTASAETISANKRDMVGSIGTRILLFDYSEYAKNEGIKALPIDTGEHKSAGAFGTEITDAQVAEFQRIVDGYFSDFKQHLLSNRPIEPSRLDELADGRVFFANEEPIEHGLIDKIQGLQDSVNQLVVSQPQTRRTTAQARLNMLNI